MDSPDKPVEVVWMKTEPNVSEDELEDDPFKEAISSPEEEVRLNYRILSALLIPPHPLPGPNESRVPSSI